MVVRNVSGGGGGDISQMLPILLLMKQMQDQEEDRRIARDKASMELDVQKRNFMLQDRTLVMKEYETAMKAIDGLDLEPEEKQRRIDKLNQNPRYKDLVANVEASTPKEEKPGVMSKLTHAGIEGAKQVYGDAKSGLGDVAEGVMTQGAQIGTGLKKMYGDDVSQTMSGFGEFFRNNGFRDQIALQNEESGSQEVVNALSGLSKITSQLKQEKDGTQNTPIDDIKAQIKSAIDQYGGDKTLDIINRTDLSEDDKKTLRMIAVRRQIANEHGDI